MMMMMMMVIVNSCGNNYQEIQNILKCIKNDED
jgi:hypothetical protein